MGTYGMDAGRIKSLKNKLMTFFDRSMDIQASLSVALLYLVMLCITLEVVLRYFLNRPTIWTVPITEWSMLFVTFLAAPWLLRRQGHVKVELVLNRFNQRHQALFQIFTSVLGAMSCFILVWVGVAVCWESFQRSIVTTAAVEIPMWIPLAIIPFGSSFLCIQFVRAACGQLAIWKALPKKQAKKHGKPQRSPEQGPRKR
jgi:C4-dicarboxylate transporter DctQ subunit